MILILDLETFKVTAHPLTTGALFVEVWARLDKGERLYDPDK